MSELYKVIIVGDASVGKSCLLQRYMNKQMPKMQTHTIGVEFATKEHTLKNGNRQKVQLWDTAGLERYQAMVRAHYKRTVGCLIVYSVTDRSSFESIKEKIDEVYTHAESEINIILVGNKLDLVMEDPSAR